MADESQEMGDYAAGVQGAEERLEVSAATRAAVREATGEIAAAMGEGGNNKAAITSADDFIAGFMGVRIVFLSALGTPPLSKHTLTYFSRTFRPFFLAYVP